MKPRIGLLLGDATGIGPELVAKLLAGYHVSQHADLVVIGDRRILDLGQRIAGTRLAVRTFRDLDEAVFGTSEIQLLDFPGVDPADFEMGKLSAKAGRSVLDVLDTTFDMAKAGRLNGVVFAPFNKQAMHLGGSRFPDELHYMADRIGWTGYITEVNLLENLWTSRVTSHLGLSQVSALITKQGVLNAIELIDRTVRLAGVETPRLLVAALNPHGGEGGLFGREEIDLIAPAVEEAKTRGIDVAGPFPADTIFLRAKAGGHDAVVSMYHDQGQIAMKLMGFERGVTIQGGLPIPVATPAHGTAFDIAGQGKANPGALWHAYQVTCRMAANRKQAEPPGKHPR